MSKPANSPAYGGAGYVLSKTYARSTAVLAFLYVSAAQAQSFMGQEALNWTANYIIGPLAILSLIVSIAALIFSPMMVRGAVYTLLSSIVLFAVIKQAPQILSLIKQ